MRGALMTDTSAVTTPATDSSMIVLAAYRSVVRTGLRMLSCAQSRVPFGPSGASAVWSQLDSTRQDRAPPHHPNRLAQTLSNRETEPGAIEPLPRRRHAALELHIAAGQRTHGPFNMAGPIPAPLSYPLAPLRAKPLRAGDRPHQNNCGRLELEAGGKRAPHGNRDRLFTERDD